MLGKRFGFSLEEIRQLLDLYHVGDQRKTQMARTYDVANERLAEMVRQRDTLSEAIEDLKHQMRWGEKMIASINQSETKAD